MSKSSLSIIHADNFVLQRYSLERKRKIPKRGEKNTCTQVSVLTFENKNKGKIIFVHKSSGC